MLRRTGIGLVLALLVALSACAQQGNQKATTAYKRSDYAVALNELRPLADQGDAAAQYNLGRMYFKCQGVAQDYAKALNLFRKAAEQGFTPAQFNLGLMYDKGEGVSKDYVFAHMWYSLGVAGGDKNATKKTGA